jgi:hypothetical protein
VRQPRIGELLTDNPQVRATPFFIWSKDSATRRTRGDIHSSSPDHMAAGPERAFDRCRTSPDHFLI